jgi:hypothetical protein
MEMKMYKRTAPMVYAVHWPEINVFKIGYSDCQRWKLFMNRGANLLSLMEFGSTTEAFDFESACHLALWPSCGPASSPTPKPGPT